MLWIVLTQSKPPAATVSSQVELSPKQAGD